MNDFPDPLRLEIAAAAARLLADGATDYASAKRKAAQRVLGERVAAKASMPDNEEIDAALLEHLQLFDDGHAERVVQRRRAAADLMRLLEAFRPYLTGAVWKGIVTEHAPIHLQLFHDNTKDVQIDLLNRGVDFEVASVPHFRGGPDVEAITQHTILLLAVWLLFAVLLALPLAVPSYVAAFTWVSVADLWTSGPGARFEGFLAAVVVLTLYTYPYVYLPVAAALVKVDPGQEEVARSLGRGRCARC